MKFKDNNADASFYYYEDATVDVARMDSSAVYGNLADIMKMLRCCFHFLKLSK